MNKRQLKTATITKSHFTQPGLHPVWPTSTIPTHQHACSTSFFNSPLRHSQKSTNIMVPTDISMVWPKYDSHTRT